MSKEQAYFVFDSESLGLYGLSFWVAGGVFINSKCVHRFDFSCPRSTSNCMVDNADWDWIKENIPEYKPNCKNAREVRDKFWQEWIECKNKYNCIAAVECGYPVETNFLAACVKDDELNRKFAAPYPLIEISTVMSAAGMDPMKTYDRLPDELPKHNPMADTNQSARLLFEALDILEKWKK